MAGPIPEYRDKPRCRRSLYDFQSPAAGDTLLLPLLLMLEEEEVCDTTLKVSKGYETTVPTNPPKNPAHTCVDKEEEEEEEEGGGGGGGGVGGEGGDSAVSSTKTGIITHPTTP